MVDSIEVAPAATPVETVATETRAEAAAAARPWLVPTVVLYTVLVIVAWVGVELWGLGTVPFHTKGEPREGLVVWQMTHQGGWILPRIDGPDGLEIPSKPPMFHWLAAIASLIHGATDEWSIRLPSAALSLIALLCVFAAGTALWSPRAGLLAALTLMTMFEWARASTGARVDMTLTFGLQLAFLSLLFFLRSRAAGWLIPLYAGMALAALGKGPVGVALPGLAALLMLALTRDVTFLRQMRLGYGALAVGTTAGSWYVMALILGGRHFFEQQILAENVFRLLGQEDFSGGHVHSASYLLGALLLGLLPWTLFLPAVVARLWRQRRQLSRNDSRMYLMVWIAVVFSVYAFAVSKRGVYLLSLYPALALLLGWWWDEQRQALPEEDRWLAQLLPFVGWTLTGLLALISVVVLLETVGIPIMAVIQWGLPASAKAFAPWIGDTMRSGRWLLLGLLLTAAVSLYVCIRAAHARRWTEIFAGIFGAAAALTMSVNRFILPGIAEHMSFRSFMAEVRQTLAPGDDLFFFKTFEYGPVFYWQEHIPRYQGPWPAGAPRYLLMEKEEWDRMRPSASDQYEQVPFAGRKAADSPLVLIRRIGQ
jgi:4-amino-4-deoxy-L-arabinose transferase-like glycosyltransferase